MPLSKADFLAKLSDLYSVCNASDADANCDRRAEWTHPDMAGPAGARLFDTMLNEMVSLGVLTREEFQTFYDEMI